MSKILIANWKMNPKTLEEAKTLWLEYQKMSNFDNSIWSQILVACPSIYFGYLEQSKEIIMTAQDVSSQEFGAFTGEISARMISSIGVNHVLIGHSETRMNQQYSNLVVAQKVTQAISNNLQPIICVGYEPDINSQSTNLDILREQIVTSLASVALDEINESSKPIFAFEPTWAIGTGLTPTIEQIEELTRFVKDVTLQEFNTSFQVLYGGSVNDKNIRELYSISNVDGFLVGGASLKLEVMSKIVAC